MTTISTVLWGVSWPSFGHHKRVPVTPSGYRPP